MARQRAAQALSLTHRALDFARRRTETKTRITTQLNT